MGVIYYLNSDFESCVNMINTDIWKIGDIFFRYIKIDIDTRWDGVEHIEFRSTYFKDGGFIAIDEGTRERVFSELRLLYKDVNFKYDTLGGYLKDIDSYRPQFEGGDNDFEFIYNNCKKTHHHLYQKYSGNVITNQLNILYKTVELRK